MWTQWEGSECPEFPSHCHLGSRRSALGCPLGRSFVTNRDPAATFTRIGADKQQRDSRPTLQGVTRRCSSSIL
ncbi:hypothetical protein DPEC_G00153410 [Dallia pectoralis]|uniref:Uncharacterized protein n=1 Tax=Dallia pectoralis TaxID=75939 RepID=A0ACC2GK82_DALPE|nr:hypothetical protein DPEC_G00153410 [Dallia pectoralis]